MGTGHAPNSLCGQRWWVPCGLVLWPRGALPSGLWWPSGAPLLAVSSSGEITYLQFFWNTSNHKSISFNAIHHLVYHCNSFLLGEIDSVLLSFNVECHFAFSNATSVQRIKNKIAPSLSLIL